MASVDAPKTTSLEEAFRRRLVERGLLKEVRPAPVPPVSRDEHDPIQVDGTPVSEMIIQERR